MSAYDPSDLMALCEVIMEDGELSGREIYRLSRWLNENREACQHWPGNLLVGPLQSSWSDSKLSTAELQEIGRLLVEIHRELICNTGETFDPIPEIAADILQRIDLTRPMLPLFSCVTRAKSRIGQAEGYDVDLSQPSCTCLEWQENRKELPLGHLSRCCRHVLHAYSRIHPKKGWPGWLRAFLGHQRIPHPRKQWMVINRGDSLVLASTAPHDWADVFAPEDGEYERFGYHILEDRWAYDSEPADSSYLRNRIRAATRATSCEVQVVRRVRLRLPQSLRPAPSPKVR